MGSFRKQIWSSVGKKLITGVTGLALVGFVCVHLLGNLTLFIGAEAFNGYTYFLEHLVHGWFVYAFEIVLIAIAAFHILSAVYVAWIDKRRARPDRYAVQRNAKGASRKTLSSTTMIYTGVILLVFIVLHVKMFKFADHATIVRPDGHTMKDLYSVVIEAFQNPLIVFSYVAVMILLGFHLRHGFWSALQSLGWAKDRTLPALTGIALVLAIVLAVGFLILPLHVYFFVEPGSGATAMMGGH